MADVVIVLSEGDEHADWVAQIIEAANQAGKNVMVVPFAVQAKIELDKKEPAPEPPMPTPAPPTLLTADEKAEMIRRIRPYKREEFEAREFTVSFARVLEAAQGEAQRFYHNYIGTEHLLLGLVRTSDNIAHEVLRKMGVELHKVRSATEFIVGRGDRVVQGEVGLTPRVKKVLDLAADEARRLNSPWVGCEHLLLGLVREGEGIAAGVLESLGVSLDRVRAQVIHTISSYPAISTERKALLDELGKVQQERMQALEAKQYELAAELRDREFKLRQQIDELESKET